MSPSLNENNRWSVTMCRTDPDSTPTRTDFADFRLVAYNLIRTVMWEAARRHEAPLDRISFKGAVDSVRQYCLALSRARTQKKAATLVRALLATLAADLVPHRPGRREPRALKRRPKPYSLLTNHRYVFKEIPHRGKYRKSAVPQFSAIRD